MFAVMDLARCWMKDMGRWLGSKGKVEPSVLLTDILFPSRFSRWRICEITSFIKEKSADILVFKVGNFAGIKFETDYEIMRDRQGFAGYNIFIFDPQFSYLNKFNSRIDGTAFNHKFPASYLFSKHADFNLTRYRLVYHIFLMCYTQFNSVVKFPHSRQAIHLYPGGGYASAQSLSQLSPETRIISTNPRTSAELSAMGHKRVIECKGAPLFTLGEKIPMKALNSGEISICFASMGHGLEKGAAHYQYLADKYYQRYPGQPARFVAVGNIVFKSNIISFPPMDMHDLMEFYTREIDVMVSLDTGVAYNGWPLGAEAAICGAVLLTTDPHQSQRSYGISDAAVHCFTIDDINGVVDLIASLNRDRFYLHRRSIACQKEFSKLFSYRNQQARIYDFLEI